MKRLQAQVNNSQQVGAIGIEALIKANCAAALIITDGIIDKEHQALLPRHTVIYRPKSLVIGIGCNQGNYITISLTIDSSGHSHQRFPTEATGSYHRFRTHAGLRS